MRLATLNRVLCVVLTSLAALPLLLGGELPVLVWVAMAASMLTGVMWGAKPWPRVANVAVTSGVIGAFGLLVVLSLQSGDWLPNSFIFGLIATSARALQLPTSRQQFQIVGLSFLLLIASAVGNPDLSFALFFVVYTVLLTWALTSIHFLEKVERTMGPSSAYVSASQLLTRKFLVGSSLLALALLASSLLLFFLFPRMGLGFFSAQTRRGTAVSGFTDTVKLGHFGTIRDSQRVILRLEFPGALPGDPAGMHIRGMALDRYQDGVWSRSHIKHRPMRADEEGFYEIPDWALGAEVRGPRMLMDVYAEPLEEGNTVAFTVARAVRIRPEASRFDRYRGMEKRFTVDSFGSIYVQRGRHEGVGSLSYAVEVVEPLLNQEARQQEGGDWPEWFANLYLQLPADLDPRIPALAREWTGEEPTLYGKASRIESTLRESFEYTLEGVGVEGDPVSFFLFERKKGHCEYFASSMVLLLRSAGVPARLVNGFLGASLNEFGDYYVVTESRAHSWVEAYIPGAGWIVFDPTPSSGAIGDSGGFFAEISAWFDSLRLTWFKWVVEYDLDQQIEMYVKIWNSIASNANQIHMEENASLGDMREQWKKVRSGLLDWSNLWWFGGFVLVAVGLPLLFRRLKGRKRKDRGEKLRDQLMHLLARKGVAAHTGETLPQLAEKARALGFAGAGEVALLVERIEEYRWSEGGGGEAAEISRGIRRLKRHQGVKNQHGVGE